MDPFEDQDFFARSGSTLLGSIPALVTCPPAAIELNWPARYWDTSSAVIGSFKGSSAESVGGFSRISAAATNQRAAKRQENRTKRGCRRRTGRRHPLPFAAYGDGRDCHRQGCEYAQNPGLHEYMDPPGFCCALDGGNLAREYAPPSKGRGNSGLGSAGLKRLVPPGDAEPVGAGEESGPESAEAP